MVEDAKMSAQMMLGYAVILAILIVMDILMNSSFECDDYLADDGIGLLGTPEEVAGAQLFSQALVQISACTLARIPRRTTHTPTPIFMLAPGSSRNIITTSTSLARSEPLSTPMLYVCIRVTLAQL